MQWLNKHRNTGWMLGLLAGVLLITALVIAGVLLLTGQGGSGVSGVGLSSLPCLTRDAAEDPVCLRFPAVTGDSLSGQSHTLPDNFAGRYQMVVVTFDQNQQAAAAEWLPLAHELSDQYPELTYYSVLVFPGDISAAFRGVIRVGLNAVITEDLLRDRIITVFVEDRDRFLDALAIPDVETLEVLLLADDGQMVWRGSGGYSETLGTALRQQIAALFSVDGG
jgi:hypothetical protein